MRKKLFIACVIAVGLVVGKGRVGAAVTYGSGTYVNLCGGGIAANVYSCDVGCDPTKGSCAGGNEGVVRWECSGKWNQCVEGENNWGDFQSVGDPGCGKTVQLSLFDKKCRKSDGAWDDSCKLLGYMVWYSGDCGGGGTTVGVSPTVRATGGPTGKVSPTVTVRPTITVTVRPTVTGTVGPTVRPSPTARPSPTVRPTRTPVPTRVPTGRTGGDATGSGVRQTPETGGEMWWVLGGAVVLATVGWQVRKWARNLW